MSVCLNCGTDSVAARSSLDHRRLFGIIRAAYHHWPHQHSHKPVDFDHFRAWIFCKVDYCWVDEFNITSLSGVSKDVGGAMLKVFFDGIEARQGHKFWDPVTGGLIRCRTARSGSFDSLDQKGFNALRDAISAIIEHELNMSVSRLLKEHEAAA